MLRAISLVCFAFIFVFSIAFHYQKDTNYSNIGGSYLLEFITKKADGGYTVIPFILYDNPQFAYFQCNTQKKNIESISGNILWRYGTEVSCTKYYGEEI